MTERAAPLTHVRLDCTCRKPEFADDPGTRDQDCPVHGDYATDDLTQYIEDRRLAARESADSGLDDVVEAATRAVKHRGNRAMRVAYDTAMRDLGRALAALATTGEEAPDAG
jgi:hypothetical protein